MPILTHTAIMASAGCGKTYALNSRLIALLAQKVTPDRIVALTFTKAAAGEIFDKLVGRLANATLRPEKRNEENQALREAGIAAQPATAYAAMLRTLVNGMHVARIGTLDGFFAALVRAFPLELGVSAGYSIMDPHAGTTLRERILRRLLAPPQDEAAAQAQRAFREAFKRTTFGEEAKTVYCQLHDFVMARHPFLLQAPAPEKWGCRDTIWPQGSRWVGHILAAEELTATAHAFLTGLPARSQPRQRAKWEEFCAFAQNFSLAGLTDKPMRAFVVKLLQEADDLVRGEASITVYQAMDLGTDACHNLLTLLQHITSRYLALKMEYTQGLYAILSRYEDEYEQLARRAGKLAFADLTHLLNRTAAGGGADTPLPLARLDIDYRLDGQFDHWAVDEFQDTSRQQWSAVRNLVDEVIQDNSGERTFFMVGDVKQAIYGWRGGDSRLMAEIRDYYDLQTLPLNASRRSCPAVIDAVNRVFACVPEFAPLPPHVRTQWQALWAPHTIAGAAAGQSGCTQVLEVPLGKENAWEPVAALFRRTEPWKRGLTAAVLVRTGDQGHTMTAGLRAAHIPVVWESDKTIAGHPLVAACLALFRYTSHPADTLAREHIRMSPLAPILQAPGFAVSHFLERVHRDGFAGTVRFLLDEIAARHPAVSTAGPELELFLSSAQTFDGGGSRDGLEFADYIESFTAKDTPPLGKVRVMTLHHSKGLEFDLVVLPLTPGRMSMTTLNVSEEMLYREPPLGQAGAADTGGLDWLLDAPGFMADTDPVLRTARDAQVDRECFEDLCSLYVGMTRAKRGLYALVPPLPQKSEALHLHHVVRRGLAGQETQDVRFGDVVAKQLYVGGNEAWHESVPAVVAPRPPGTPEAPPPAPAVAVGCQPVPRLRRVLPSHMGAAAGAVPAATVRLATGGGRGREFGTALHALCAELEWYDGRAETVAATVQRWRQAGDWDQSLAAAVEAHFRKALECDEIRQALQRPPEPRVDLWRERSFDVIVAGEWVTGTFDRVVVTRRQDGRAASATVLDFKSDSVRDDAERQQALQHYRGQLNLYRRALAQALNLPQARVQALLLFTGPGRCVNVAA